MAITSADIKALDYGYLTGKDLLNYCPEQILIKEHIINDTKIEDGVYTAYTEVISHLSTRYDLTNEMDKTTDRNNLLVKLMAIRSLVNICSDLSGITDNMKSNFDWSDRTLKDIRNGQISLVGVKTQENEVKASVASMVKSSFYTLG